MDRHLAGPLEKQTVPILVGFFCGCGNVRVFLLETLHSARRIDQLLLPGKEWVAIRANFDAQHVALDRRACLESVSASAMDGYRVIIGVDSGFHNSPFVVSGLRGNSLIENHSHVARSRDNH